MIRQSNYRTHTARPIAAALLAVVLIAACGAPSSQSGATADAQHITVVARDTMRFEPATLTVEAGRPVRLTLRNEGTLVHDVTLRPGPPKSTKQIRAVASGNGTASATFIPTASGTYTFVCSQAGHEAAGMTGSLQATDGGAAAASVSRPAA